MINLAMSRRNLLTAPVVKAKYDRLRPINAVVGKMIEARLVARLTEVDIAAGMATTQSVIARLENAVYIPTFDLIARYAATIDRRVDTHLVLRVSP